VKSTYQINAYKVRRNELLITNETKSYWPKKF